jgi:hypothetical protein
LGSSLVQKTDGSKVLYLAQESLMETLMLPQSEPWWGID